MNKTKATVLVGKTVKLKLTGDTIKSISVKNKKIASVNENGTVKGLKAGKTTVNITGKSNKKYSCALTVKKGLTKTTVYITKGKKTTITLAGTQVKSVSSSKKSVAAVAKKGKTGVTINAKKKGTATITVKGKDNKTYTCEVTVETPSLSTTSLTLAKGNNGTLKLKNTKQKLTWSTADKKIATVNKNGKVTAVAKGKTTIKAKDASGKTYSCKVTVETPKMATSLLYMDVGQSADLVLAGNTQKVTWTSSNKKIVTVNSAGKVKAVAEGTANVKAKVKSGKTYTCKVIVNAVKKNETEKTATGTDSGDGVKAGTGDKDFPDDDVEDHPSTEEDDDDDDDDDSGSTTEQESHEPVVVTFSVEHGSLLPINVPYGTTIGALPEPEYDEGFQFMGYYDDAEFSEKLSDDTKLTETAVLYAKSVEMDVVQTTDEASTITAIKDAEQDYAITILSSDPGMTVEDVAREVTAVNVNHNGSEEYQKKENIFTVSGGNGTFVLTGRHIFMQGKEPVDGFEAGASYTFKLPDLDSEGNCTLTFDGYPKTVREYDVSIAQKEQNNLALQSDVVTISVESLDALLDADGNQMEYIDGSFYTIDAEGHQTESDNINGYFELSGEIAGEIKSGTSIALYSGMNPGDALMDPEAFERGDNHIAYLTVNKIDGNKFYFGNAEIEDVLKTPEVLPIPSDADLALDDNENTLEIPVSYLDWSDDKYYTAKLDSATQVDVGDYIALYAGEYGSDDMIMVGDYQLVTDIVTGGATINTVGDDIEYWVITTEKTTLESIADSGTTYTTRPVDILSELSQEEIARIKEEVQAEAMSSGFVGEAGTYLGTMAMATNGFKEAANADNVSFSELVVRDQEGNILTSTADEDEESVSMDSQGSKANAFYQKYHELDSKYKEMRESYKQFMPPEEDGGPVDVKLDDLWVDIYGAEELPSGTAVSLHVKFTVEVTVPKYEGKKDDDKKEDGDKDKDKDSSSDKDKDSSSDKDKDSSSDKDKDSSSDKKDGDKKDDDKKEDDDDEAEEENKLIIEVSADFVQEIQLSMGFGASVEFTEVAGFLPVPTDIIFTPSFTTGTYTGIDVNALVYTGGEDDGMGDSILDDQKEIASDRDEIINDITEELKSLMEEDGEEEEEEEAESIATWLSVHYKEMLEQEHDAITLVEKTLYEAKYEAVPGLVQLAFELKFKVTVDVVVSLGFEFSNIQSKKTIYTIHVLKASCSSETIELIPTETDFKFYVMGSLEIKVGFELEFSLELLEGILGSASLTVGVGAYLDLYGFFYYHVNILSGVKTTNMAGAMFVEIGIYLEIGTSQQVGKNFKGVKGKIAEFEQPWLEKQFPLKEWGENEVPLDFNMPHEDYPEVVKLRQYVTKLPIPDDWVEVSTMTLDEGDFGTHLYENECYGVDLTNNAFGYDAETRTVYLKDGYDGMEAECDVTIYFKNGYIPLSHVMMKRTIHLTWDNYLSGYAIALYSNGGSYVESIVGEKGAKVTAPADPTKKGYVFDGWYTKDGNAYTFPETMPYENVDVYAHWKPADDTPYLVYYYKEDPNLEGSYILSDVKQYTGTTDSTVEASRIDIDGYVTPDAEQITIEPTGSAVLRYYYDIKRSTYTFKTGEHGTTEAVPVTKKLGENIIAPVMTAQGYEFIGWKNVDTNEVISSDEIVNNRGIVAQADGNNAVYEAQWQLRSDILYRVEYYVQETSGAYTVKAIEYGKGQVGDEITEDMVRELVVKGTVVDEFGVETEMTGKADDLFLEKEGDIDVVYYDGMTFDGIDVNGDNPAVIKADGSSVIKVKYSRKMLKVTLKSSGTGDESDVYREYDVCYGGKMALPVPERRGYTFLGYKDKDNKTLTVDETTGFAIITVKKDAVYTSAGWEPNKYTVSYKANGGTLSGQASESFTYDVEQVLQAAPSRESYVFTGWKDQDTENTYQAGDKVTNLTSRPNGIVKLTAQWEEEGYSVTYDLNGGEIAEGANPTTYTQQMDEKTLSYPEKTGYVFDGWFAGDKKIVTLPGGNKGDLALTASWTPRNDVIYVVNHYQEAVGGEDKVLVERETLTGTADTAVTPVTRVYDGFTAPDAVEKTIAADGSLVVDYVYTRKLHTLTIVLDGGSMDEDALKAVTADGNVDMTGAEYVTVMATAAEAVEPAESDEEAVMEEASLEEATEEAVPEEALETTEEAGETEENEDESLTAPGEPEMEVLGTALTGTLTCNYYYGQNLDLPVPVKDGFVFAGWMAGETIYTGGTMPDEDVTLTATWADSTVTCEVIHYLMDLDGNYTIVGNREFVTGAEGETVTVQAGSYEGFVSPESVDVTLSAESTEPVVLEYERRSATVNWVLGDGACDSEYTSGSVYFEQPIIAPVPVREGYAYTWDQEPATVMGTEDLTYTAVWTAKEIHAAFDTMGGTLTAGDAAEITLQYGEPYGTLPEPSKEYAEFLGWYDASEDGNEITQDTAVAIGSDHILYARWQYVTAAISYEGIEETDVNDNPERYEIGKVTAIKAPERKGYTFQGWLVNGGTELVEDYTISSDATDDLVLEAKWEVQTFTLSLYNAQGLYFVKTFEADADTSSVPAAKKDGYRLSGWKNIVTGEILEAIPEKMPGENLELSAQWEEIIYRVVFENIYDVTVDPVTWKLGDNAFKLQPPTTERTGYDFAGWYTDMSYAEDTLIEYVKPVATNVTVYAKWIPHTYEINLYFEGGKSQDGKDRYTDTEDNVFTYDESKAIKKISELGLTRNGYTFGGWSLKSGESAQYSDGAVFGAGNNLSAGDEIVNMYAVWDPITYNISYENISAGADGTEDGSNNPVSYSPQDDDVKLKNPTGIREGYQFLGWYDAGGQLVENLKLKDEWGDKTLTAKWAYAGKFSIKLKSSSSASPNGNGTTTFVITRSMPSGVAVADDPQRVYFRTVNGTAVGGAVEVTNVSTGQKTANNFLHVGGQNTFAVFGPDECYAMVDNKKQAGTINSDGSATAEFKVTLENVSIRYCGDEVPTNQNGYVASTFNLSSNRTRYYTAELYRIKSTRGEITGLIGTKEARRNMTMPSDKVLDYNAIYGTKTVTSDYEYELANGDDADDFDELFTHPKNIGGLVMSDKLGYYRQAAITGILGARYECGRTHKSVENDSVFTIRYFLNGEQLFENAHDDDDPGYTDDRAWRSWSYANIGFDKGNGVNFTFDDVAKGAITFRADVKAGIAKMRFKWYNWEFNLSFNDSRGPRQVGIAPAATTDYEKGDEVRFSVVYNELINNYGNVSVDVNRFKTYMPITNVRCTGGAGTNVLTFTGTATENFSNTTWNGSGTNAELMRIQPVSNSVVYDLKGNS